MPILSAIGRKSPQTRLLIAAIYAALGLGAGVAAIEAARGVSFAKDDGLRFTHRDALYPLFEQAIAAQQAMPEAARRRLRRGGTGRAELCR